jgi:hypothetical protein
MYNNNDIEDEYHFILECSNDFLSAPEIWPDNNNTLFQKQYSL